LPTHEAIGVIVLDGFNANIDPWYGWDDPAKETYTLLERKEDEK